MVEEGEEAGVEGGGGEGEVAGMLMRLMMTVKGVRKGQVNLIGVLIEEGRG